MKFHGSFPALITPYNKDKSINFIEISQLARMHMHYSDGLVLSGSTGEGWLITLQEQRKIFEIVHQEFSKPIIVNAPIWSAAGLEQMLSCFEDHIEHIAGLLIAAPSYLKLNEHQVIRFFESCAAISPIPIIVYHIPSRNNIIFTQEIMAFISDHPTLIGIKETRWDNFEKYFYLPNIIRFAGDDEFLSSPLVTSSINVGGNLYPKEFSKKSAYFDWSSWQKILNMATNPLVIKTLMHHHKLIAENAAREPLGQLPAKTHQQILNVFDHFSLEMQDKITALPLVG